jgi:hypothetical protein
MKCTGICITRIYPNCLEAAYFGLEVDKEINEMSIHAYLMLPATQKTSIKRRKQTTQKKLAN